MKRGSGWHNESRRHSLAGHGIKTIYPELKAKCRLFKGSKVKIGDIVKFEGKYYVVTAWSSISHPEHLIGGERAKSGYYVQLFPVMEWVEEPSGWINQARIKVLPKNFVKEMKEVFKKELNEIAEANKDSWAKYPNYDNLKKEYGW